MTDIHRPGVRGTPDRSLASWYLGVAVTGADAAAVAYIMPALRRDLGVDAQSASWLLTLFILGSLVGTPLGASVARIWGVAPTFRLACLLLGLGSVVSATGPGLSAVLAGRLLQGIGSGPALPLAASMVTRAWPPERHGRLLASLSLVYGASFLVSVVATPLVLSVSWRWVYMGEALACAIAWVAAGRSLQATPIVDVRWDLPGLITWVLSLSCLSLVINRIQGGATSGSSITALTSLGIVLAAVFVVLELRPGAAVLPLSIFRHGGMRIVLALCLGTGIGQVVLVQVPSLAGARLGITPEGSGVLMLPVIAGGLVASVLTIFWLDRLGPRTVLIVGALATLAGVLIASGLSPSRRLFLVAAALLGIGVSALSGGPLRYIAARATDASEHATTQAAVAMLTNVGVLGGSLLVGTLVGSSPNERFSWERAMLVSAIVMAVAFLPALALRRHA